MSVMMCEIESLRPILDADRIEVARIRDCDYEFVVQKNAFHEGDLVVYFPLDSLLPRIILEEIGMWDFAKGKGKLGGKEGNRVRTVRLRDQISQGLLADPVALHLIESKLGDDVTAILEVDHYEQEPIRVGGSELRPLPIPFYDIWNTEEKPGILAALSEHELLVTEKMDGMNFALHYNGEEMFYCQRRYHIADPPPHHVFRRAAAFDSLEEKIILIFHRADGKPITIRGEIVGPGIRRNYYDLESQRVFVFDIDIDGKPLGGREFMDMKIIYDIETVPVLAHGLLSNIVGGKTLREFSNGQSVIQPTKLREGIVIRPLEEQMLNGERLIVKQRDPIYLSEEL